MMTNPFPFFVDPADVPAANQHFLMPGEVGALEAVLDFAKSDPRARWANPPVAVVCHPHPLHGGTLTNKVAHTVAKAFAELGVTSLR